MKKVYILIMVMPLMIFSACRSDKQKMEDAKHADEVNDDKLQGGEEKTAGFLVDIANMNLSAIHLSELAYQKASMEETKDMASKMLTDHRLALAEITVLAQKRGVVLPTTPDAEATREYDRIDKSTGADFDKEYADQMVKDHEKAIKTLEGIINDTGDFEIKTWAEANLPTLKTHLELAQHCQDMAKDMKK